MSRITITRRAMLTTGLVALTTPAFARVAGAIYRDPTAPLSDRVRDLLARMTIDEKVAQMRVIWLGKFGIFGPDGHLLPDKATKPFANGIGQIARPADTMGTSHFAMTRFRDPEDAATIANEMQRFLVENTRLGIPALFHEETAHGLQASGATIFPIPPALASTWDPALVEEVFTVTAREARSRGATIGLSPVLDLMRDPRFGRVEEFFSEDPYLAGQIGVAAVRGLQGRARPLGKDRIFATLKHFIHGSPEAGLNIAPANMTERDLRENYLVPFAQVVKDADPAAIMPSYNEVGGVPAHANVDLLQKTGRGLIGFKGVYMSDYGGIENLVTHHHMAANPTEAAVLALNAGVDVEMPEGATYVNLPALVKQGRVSEAQIDAAVARILALKFEAGLFENPYVDPARVLRRTNTTADVALARKAAQRALILLNNDGVLPLDPAAKLKLAIIGPNAAEPVLGGYSGENAKAIGILAGIKAAAGPDIAISHADGVWITQPDAKGRPGHSHYIPVPAAENAARLAEAVAVAQKSDVILLVIGDRPEVTREAVMFDQPGDRDSLGLFGDQDKLVDAMLATGKPVIALLLNGRPLAVPHLAEKANALLEGWYPGQEGGNAFADVLFGKVNPGGKLAVSIPRTVGDLPIFYNRHPSAQVNQYVEGRHTPLFPFGFGLSYTSFDLSAPRLAKAAIGAGEGFTVEVDVTNTGKRPGDEVVQLYIRDDVSSVPRPVLELKAFRRITLVPGETRTVRFELSSEALAFWTIDMHWAMEPGSFTISVGNSSAALKSTKLVVGA